MEINLEKLQGEVSKIIDDLNLGCVSGRFTLNEFELANGKTAQLQITVTRDEDEFLEVIPD